MTMRGDMLELEITRLAGLGDGVGEYGGKTVFVPLTMPGDRVRAIVEQVGKDHLRARLAEVLIPSAERVAAPCPHFAACGGCSLQHLSAGAYEAFKRGIALDAARQLVAEETVVRPLFAAGAASRRRAEFKVAVQKGEVVVGFLAARSHEIVPTPECRVVDAAIAAALPAWRAMLQGLKKPSSISSVQFTHADNGLDVLLHLAGRLKPADVEALRAFAVAQGILRLYARQEDGELQPMLEGEPALQLGEAVVKLPVAAFMQATTASQSVMVAEVLAGCAGQERVADLYCGCGTYSLPLAQVGHRVDAFEGGQEAVTALYNAARGLPVDARVRDLYATPLPAEDLRHYGAVVINPPRNGALPQAKAIAQSGVGRVVMVSCNPATFIRDGKALVENGYRLESLLPVDQFTWSHHLELVGIFAKSR